MTTQHETYILTTANTAYEIVSAPDGDGRDVTIQNNNEAAIVFIGGVGVNSESYGFQLIPGAAIAFELNKPDAIWAFSNLNNATVNIMSVSLEGTHIV